MILGYQTHILTSLAHHTSYLPLFFYATLINPQLTCASSFSQLTPSVLILAPTQHAYNLNPRPSCSILFSIILICTFRPLVNACSGLKKTQPKTNSDTINL